MGIVTTNQNQLLEDLQARLPIREVVKGIVVEATVTETEETASQNISFTVSTIEDSSMLSHNPFSSEGETSERSDTATPMPDMEIITPVNNILINNFLLILLVRLFLSTFSSVSRFFLC